MIWRLQESKCVMNKWEANRLRWHFNINKLCLIWIQELNRIRNGKWGVFSLPDPRNKEKMWNHLLHHSRFPLEYVKRRVQSLQKGSEENQYVVSYWDNIEQIIRNTIWVQLNIYSGIHFQLRSMHMYLGVYCTYLLSNALRHESELSSC